MPNLIVECGSSSYFVVWMDLDGLDSESSLMDDTVRRSSDVMEGLVFDHESNELGMLLSVHYNSCLAGISAQRVAEWAEGFCPVDLILKSSVLAYDRDS